MDYEKFVKRIEFYLMRHVAPQEEGIVRAYWRRGASPIDAAAQLRVLDRLG